ncbi:MAG: hypothetical protein E6560_12715 [Yersiniaceae bacterium]|uniref:Fimbrial protein n=1 Tax=Chimaeribacter coloradensis TaxID=2060068 RepID=A0A2N5E9I0_9GAMM|nr:hypothetical protein [Chimaeribacter coloradensis]MDU6411805.1 hypothetical protein [Yersiniaceae bacterium]PLR38554.1 hypothetical protein CYR32_06110 [Chimaeribacter coloradensis]
MRQHLFSALFALWVLPAAAIGSQGMGAQGVINVRLVIVPQCAVTVTNATPTADCGSDARYQPVIRTQALKKEAPLTGNAAQQTQLVTFEW